MNKHYLWIALVCGASLAEQPLRESPRAERHKVGVQVPFWIRANARFTGFDLTDVGPDNGQGDIERFYVDGYNKLDITGNAVTPPPPARYAFPRTSNFKFMNFSQVRNDPDPTDSEELDPNGGTLSLHGVTVTGGNFAKDRNPDLTPGVELFYRYEMVQKPKWSLGFEAGVAGQRLDWHFSHPSQGMVNVITDVYPLGGVVLRPIHAGQEGAFDDETGRRPVIGSVPQRSSSETVGVISGKHELNLDAVFVRLGPSLTWQATRRWEFDALAGVSVGLARTEYRYSNRAVGGLSVDGVPLPIEPQSGKVSDSSVPVGFYSAVRANFRLTNKWDAQAEVRHLWQGPISLSSPRGSAEIDLANGLAVVIGVGRRF